MTDTEVIETAAAPLRDFDPTRYMTKVSGSDYLEVKWRLLWFRNVHPDGDIETEMIENRDQTAVFRARVSAPGAGSATGWGTETYSDFRDYIEKAETKAVGRALAAMGFGTQFCQDFNFGAEQNRVVDSPVSLQRQQERRQTDRRQAGGGQGGGATGDQPSTARQHGFIEAMSRELGISNDALKLEVEATFGTSVTGLNRRDASVLIERLQQRRNDPSWQGARNEAAQKPAAVSGGAPEPEEPEGAPLLRWSGLTHHDLTTDLSFAAPVSVQHEEWEAEIRSIVNDGPQSEESRALMRTMTLMAMDAVAIDDSQHWRFSALAAQAVDEQQLTAIETAYQKTGVKAGEQIVKKSAADRRRKLRG